MRDVTNRGALNLARVSADEMRSALATANIVNIRAQSCRGHGEHECRTELRARTRGMRTLSDSKRHCEERSDAAIQLKQRKLDCFPRTKSGVAMTAK
jgi:hypothetical protein